MHLQANSILPGLLAFQYAIGVRGCYTPPRDAKIQIRDVPHPGNVRTALNNVRVFDGNCINKPSSVYIDNGVIVSSLPNPDVVVDAKGGVLLPGLIDSHCHVTNMTHLEILSSYGVTTAMTMSCYSYPLCHSFVNQTGLTSFFFGGLPAQGPGSNHAINMQTPPNELIYNASQADQFVANVFGNGSNWLKITAEQNGPAQDTQNALVAAAHARGQMAMTHAADLIYYQQAILSKTDGIQHAPADKNLSSDMVALMVKQKQHSTPTMELARLIIAISKTNPSILDHLGVGQDASYEVWRSNVMAIHKAGIQITAGTDASDAIPIGYSPFGWTLHEELYNLVDAGFAPAEALRAATSLPAQIHGLHDRGKILPGMRADLLLLEPGADPLRNISSTRAISKVWVAGIEYQDVARNASVYTTP